ncbi:WD repeat domain-containing protein 83-like [Plakobranchus ocellatus]|uniref:WD repeat domain-containing protein 83-like n=1 Tax=Plakobranchus ocellatus TaxID=259542 RepID=A0AAV3Y3U8_9GAST|nr:WD repeat domain-containing protein 83-like [Plakobranchus ocellatus]
MFNCLSSQLANPQAMSRHQYFGRWTEAPQQKPTRDRFYVTIQSRQATENYCAISTNAVKNQTVYTKLLLLFRLMEPNVAGRHILPGTLPHYTGRLYGP